MSKYRSRAWIGAHPVAGFVLLAYGISYLAGAPVLFAGLSTSPADARLLHTYLPRTLVVSGPGVAALIVAGASRSGGAERLVARLIPSPADVGWAAVVLIAGSAASVAALSFAGVGPLQACQVAITNPGLLLAHFALQVSIVAVGEELGWRGWLLVTLLERTNRFRAMTLGAGGGGHKRQTHLGTQQEPKSYEAMSNVIPGATEDSE